MADFEPPSFSLGLDFDLESEPQTTVRKDPFLCKQTRPSSSNPSFFTIENDHDFETPTMGPEPQVLGPPRTLKRLWRGPSCESASAARKRGPVELCCNVDDEIEEFSSQEDRCTANEHSSMHYHSGCSSSKFPLHGHGVLTMQSASQWKATKKKQASNTPASSTLETSSNKLMFSKSTVSPLSRFQLLDSDSDSEVYKVDSSLKEKQYNPGQYPTTSGQKRTKASVSMSQTEDLWKDVYTKKSFHIPTPALDEVCEEYFRSVKGKNEAPNLRHDKSISDNKGYHQNSNFSNNDERHCKLVAPVPPAHRYFFHDDPRIQKLVRSRLPYFLPLGAMNNGGNGAPVPPAHRYFFHDDPRIRKLVCSRLPYFLPLGAMNNGGNENPISSVIDYMSQFSPGGGSKWQAAGKTNAETSSTRGRKKSKKSNSEEASEGSGSWVSPKSSVGIPKGAGKRQVYAVGESVGHWYTDPDGKRVYVNKNGKELSGQIAFRHYKKESGAVFKKSKKKTATKKKTDVKTASKKKTAVKIASKKKTAVKTAVKKKPAAKKK